MMLKTTRKRRPPLAQLRLAAEHARKMLFAKNIVSDRSILEKLVDNPEAPILPGIPPYLPNRWTLDAVRQMIMDITKKWVTKCQGIPEKQEHIEPFFRFAIKCIEDEERKWRGKVRAADISTKDGIISDIFSEVRHLETANAMKKFIVDSFAISVIVKSNDSVSSYLEWFIEDWTPKLNKLWTKQKS